MAGPAGERRADLGLKIERTFAHPCMLVLEQMRARAGHHGAQGGHAGGGAEQGAGVVEQGDGAIGGDAILNRRPARQEDGIARRVDAGEAGAAIAGLEQVADPAAPARGRAFGVAGLPEALLVVVREKLGRERHALVGIGGLAGRLDQRADVQHHGEPAGVEDRDHRRQIRGERILAAAGQRGGGIENGLGEAVAGERDRSPQTVVEIVARLVVGTIVFA